MTSAGPGSTAYATGARLSFSFREMEMPPMEGQLLAFDRKAAGTHLGG